MEDNKNNKSYPLASDSPFSSIEKAPKSKPYDFDLVHLEYVAAGAATILKYHVPGLLKNKAKIDPTQKYLWKGRRTLTDITFETTDSANPNFKLSDVVVTVSQKKDIKKVSLAGNGGTVKEYISDGDYSISMSVGITEMNASGDISGDNATKGDITRKDVYPIDSLKLVLDNILGRNESLKVTSEFLNIFGINYIVVESYSLTQETHSNRQTLSISAVSDTPYVISKTYDTK